MLPIGGSSQGLSVGPVTLPIPSLLFYGVSGVTGHFSGFAQMGSIVQYQVPAGRSLTIKAIKTYNRALTVADTRWDIGYADALGAMDSATAPTTPILCFGQAPGVSPLSPETAYGAGLELPMNFIVPALKYPFFVQNGAGGNVMMVLMWGDVA